MSHLLTGVGRLCCIRLHRLLSERLITYVAAIRSLICVYATVSREITGLAEVWLDFYFYFIYLFFFLTQYMSGIV